MNKKYISKILLVMVACIIAYLFLLPLMFMVFTSFKGTAEAITSTSLLPRQWTLENYVELFKNTETAPIMQWLFNTCVVTVGGTVLRIPPAFCSLCLAPLEVPGKSSSSSD